LQKAVDFYAKSTSSPLQTCASSSVFDSEILAARSIDVTYETVRRWALKFEQKIAKNIIHRPAVFGDKWHLDEVVVSVNGRHRWLWRAVDPAALTWSKLNKLTIPSGAILSQKPCDDTGAWCLVPGAWCLVHRAQSVADYPAFGA
jgi:hypothetical protein